MSDFIKTILIGLFIAAAIATTVFIILFLEPSLGDGKKMLRVQFCDISGLSVKTRVSLAGKPVGEVYSIKTLSSQNRSIAHDSSGRLYFYELVLKVDSSVDVYDTDKILIQTTGLLGEKSIAITPRAPQEGKKPILITNQVLYAKSSESLESALLQFSHLSSKIESTFSHFDEWMVDNRENISKAISSFSLTMQDFNRQNVTGSIKEALDGFSDNMKLLRVSMQEFQGNNSMSKFNDILDKLSKGQGTIGKLLQSEDVHLKLNAIMSKANTLMNDLNHYGLLFQYDKHWQRTRTKRAHLLETLATSQDFKNYFETEISSISTSLSRLNLLLEKTKNSKEKEKILNSTSFKKDFLDLMQEADDLSTSLKAYNEELFDKTSSQ